MESFDMDVCNDANGVATALTEAIDGMEKLCKVSVPANATIAAGDTTVEKDEAGNNFVYVEIGTKVTVSAPATSDGKTFTGWKWGNNVISTSAKYTLYAVEDMNLTPSYEVSEAEEAVKLMCTTKYKDSKRCFIAKRSVPNGCTVKEYGVVVTDQQGWDNIYSANPETLKIRGTRTSRSYKTSSVKNGTFEARIKCPKTKKYYARAYVIYEKNGVEVTEYSKGVVKY